MHDRRGLGLSWAGRVAAMLMIAAGVVAVSPSVAMAWGRDGHRIIGDVAERELTPRTRERVRAILGGKSVTEVSTWADDVRNRPEYRSTDRYHYVNILPGAAGYDAARDCPEGACVTAAIEKYAAVLRNAQATPTEQEEALKFLVHFVGDVHQPLHAGHGRDRGGNDIQVRLAAEFGSRETNLHRLWDWGIMEATDRRWPQQGEKLAAAVTPEMRARFASLDPVVWTNESFKLSESNAYALPAGNVIDRAYVERNGPVVDERLTAAGLRLGAMLNALFDPQGADEKKPEPKVGPANGTDAKPPSGA